MDGEAEAGASEAGACSEGKDEEKPGVGID